MKARPNLSTAKARLIGCAVAGLASVIAVAAPPALASHVSCGQTITEDTKLDSDLSCSDYGIVIGASNITLNLNGHTITGDQLDTASSGVSNFDGYDGVEVKNGTIEGFTEGVTLVDAAQNELHELVVSGTNVGILLSGEGDAFTSDGSDNNSIRENEVAGNEIGIHLTRNSENNSIRENEVTGSVIAAIEMIRSHGNRIEENEASGSVFAGHSDGIFVNRQSVGNLLLENRAHNNDDDGIDVDNPNTTITGNRANYNGDLGIEAVAGVTDGGGNKAKGNGNDAQCTNVECK